MIIGVDPGFSGAVAFLINGKLHVEDMPLTKFMGRSQVDAKKLHSFVSSQANIRFAVIEDVNAMPNQGVVSTFRFGYNAGILLGVFAANNIEVLRVKPAVWKSALNLSSDKKKSLVLARKIFPANAKDFKRVKDDGRAEAALLAHFANNCF